MLNESKKELIGRDAEVKYLGKIHKGTIIDETRNTITIETNAGIKKIIKKNSTITFNKTKIKGEDIIKRPEDRIKSC